MANKEEFDRLVDSLVHKPVNKQKSTPKEVTWEKMKSDLEAYKIKYGIKAEISLEPTHEEMQDFDTEVYEVQSHAFSYKKLTMGQIHYLSRVLEELEENEPVESW